VTEETEPQYVVPCNGLEVGMARLQGEIPKAAPFAVVVGCSDARVPTEMIFGQGFNDLFVIRVAGNVLGDECIGSVDYALNVLSESVKVIIVLGHSGCGAVTAAVDAYLKPLSFWSKSRSTMLRSILQRIFVAVREAANGLTTVWGPEAKNMPGYREALIETAVCVNTAQAAYDLHVEVEKAGKWEIEVLYGVYNLHTHQVSMLNEQTKGSIEPGTYLDMAPTNPREFTAVAVQVAKRMLQNRQAASAAAAETNGKGSVQGKNAEEVAQVASQ
jgi:carbonic anhydrase